MNCVIKHSKSCTYKIWIAGNYDDAIRTCKKFCDNSFCVSVSSVDYIYTIGEEKGVCVTIINYPRFPLTGDELEKKAMELAMMLLEELHQGSFSVEGPETTIWYSRKKIHLTI